MKGVINPDTGRPVCLGNGDEPLRRTDFEEAKLSEILGNKNGDESPKVTVGCSER
jgi:hypothetical protein